MKRILLILLAVLPTSNLYSQMDNSERYTRGWNKLREIDGETGAAPSGTFHNRILIWKSEN